MRSDLTLVLTTCWPCSVLTRSTVREERSAHEGGEGRKGLLTREEGRGGKVCSQGRREREERSAHEGGEEGRKGLLTMKEGRGGNACL